MSDRSGPKAQRKCHLPTIGVLHVVLQSIQEPPMMHRCAKHVHWSDPSHTEIQRIHGKNIRKATLPETNHEFTRCFLGNHRDRHLKKETPSKQNVKDHKPYHRNIATSIVYTWFFMTGTQRESRLGFDGRRELFLPQEALLKSLKCWISRPVFLLVVVIYGPYMSIFYIHYCIFVGWQRTRCHWKTTSLTIRPSLGSHRFEEWKKWPTKLKSGKRKKKKKNIIHSSFTPERCGCLSFIGKLRVWLRKGFQNANCRMKLLRLKSRGLQKTATSDLFWLETFVFFHVKKRNQKDMWPSKIATLLRYSHMFSDFKQGHHSHFDLFIGTI